MQKIIIKNFGAVKYAEIEIKKVLVLIGEQASGKSTIAKLIYFFKTLRDDVFKKIYRDKETDSFGEVNDIQSPLREKFYDFFGWRYYSLNFEIRFYYDVEENKYVDISLPRQRRIKIEFSPNFFSISFKRSIGEIKNYLQQELNTNNLDNQFIYDQNRTDYTHRLLYELNNLFYYRQLDSLFIIAGRNVTVSYSDLFNKYFFANVQNILEKNSIQESQLKKQTIDENLMLRFIERIEKNKDIFRKFQSFEGLVESHIENKGIEKEIKQNLDIAKNKAEQILKGSYIIDNLGEKIILDTEISIDLPSASSGQQEVIRVLQDIFVNILNQTKVLRIIEEPEAHLFPVAQKNLIELLALMVNQDDDNQLIITTHSPYILSVFNNLLFAQRVVDKNPSAEAEVVELIPKEFWLHAKDFSAYSLGNSSIEEEPEYCESIFNQKTGAIKQNYLDAVSEMLGGDFNALYSIYAKSSRRR